MLGVSEQALGYTEVELGVPVALSPSQSLSQAKVTLLHIHSSCVKLTRLDSGKH